MARATKGNPLVRIDLWIPEDLKEWVKAEAERTSRSKTDIVVMALARMKGEKV